MIEKYLSDTQIGIVAIIFGIILLLHTVGIFTVGLSYILVFISIALIVFGMVKSNLLRSIMDKINKKKQ